MGCYINSQNFYFVIDIMDEAPVRYIDKTVIYKVEDI